MPSAVRPAKRAQRQGGRKRNALDMRIAYESHGSCADGDPYPNPVPYPIALWQQTLVLPSAPLATPASAACDKERGFLMTTATTTEQRLMAEAAQGRRGEVAEREKRWAAERALENLRRAERLAQLTDPHPAGCPSDALAARWEPIATRLREMFDTDERRSTWRVWIEPIHPHRMQSGVWVLAVPPRSLEWVQQRFGRLLAQVAGGVEIVACDQTNQRRAG